MSIYKLDLMFASLFFALLFIFFFNMLGSSYLYHTYKQVNTVEDTVLTSPVVEGSVDHVVFVIHVIYIYLS